MRFWALALGVTLLSARAVFCAGAIPIVFSTDVGNEIDDQWAIAYLLTQPSFDVRGILSAHAPSLPAPSAHSTYLILRDEVEQRLGLTVHPPLYEGSSLPLMDDHTPRANEATAFLIHESQGFSQNNRLHVLVIGAATDVASAVIQDPSITDRIQVIAMAFTNLSAKGGREYNVQNDVKAWQILLNSKLPITIGPGDVCRQFLALNLEQCRLLVRDHGPVGRWLWREFDEWYYRNVKPLRVDDMSRSWIIWDLITLAYERGLASAQTVPRPRLADDLSLQPASSGTPIKVINSIDSKNLWAQFISGLDDFQRRHAATRQQLFEEPQ